MTRLGIGLKRSQGLGLSKSGSLYVHAAQALFARMTTPPTTARKTLINNLIVSLQGAGVWSKLDCLYLMAAADSQAAGLNWVQNAYNLIPVAGPTFTADLGYAGNGLSSYLNTGFNPSVVVGANFVRNSASMGLYSRTSRASVNAADMGASNTVKTFIKPDSTIATPTPGFQFAANENGASSDSVHHGSLGHFAVSRTGAAALAGYFNGAQTVTTTDASTGVTDGNIFICCFNFGNAWNNGTSDQIAYSFIGGGMTAQNISDMTAALQAYLAAVGAA